MNGHEKREIDDTDLQQDSPAQAVSEAEEPTTDELEDNVPLPAVAPTAGIVLKPGP